MLIGTDEAGFGPNLGPLLIGATAWTRDDAEPFDSEGVRELLAAVASATAADDRLHLADSKDVHVAGRPLPHSPLARAARGILAAAGLTTRSLRETVRVLTVGDDPLDDVPWFAEDTLDTPDPADDLPARFAAEVAARGLTLQVGVDVIPAGAYNALLDRYESKGQLLSRRTLALLRRFWVPGTPAVIVCDKHGGRAKYGPLLEECVADCPPSATGALSLFGPDVLTLSEGRMASTYRVGDSHLTFCQKAESHVQVACASIVAKWLRERLMDAFNAYWTARQPGLAPTRGYPNDAMRWRDAFEDDVTDALWRRK